MSRQLTLLNITRDPVGEGVTAEFSDGSVSLYNSMEHMRHCISDSLAGAEILKDVLLAYWIKRDPSGSSPENMQNKIAKIDLSHPANIIEVSDG